MDDVASGPHFGQDRAAARGRRSGGRWRSRTAAGAAGDDRADERWGARPRARSAHCAVSRFSWAGRTWRSWWSTVSCTTPRNDC